MNPPNNYGASSSMSFISPWPRLLAGYPHIETVLVEAKRRRLVSSVRGALQRMRDGGYWIHDDIVKAALRQAGE